MVFVSGKGRPPLGNAKIGHVSWDEEHSCFVGTNGFYWHGRKYGGWKEGPPDALVANRKRPAPCSRGRRPRGNDHVGIEVTYSVEYDCYQTEKNYFWHGTYNGGWKKHPNGTDFASEKEESNDSVSGVGGTKYSSENQKINCEKKQKKGNTKGRRPKARSSGEAIEYDTERLCWKTDRDGGLYWHGTYNGGWKDHAPKKR
ncbi:unnamed protein product [Pseudo-nitzschia multistriata]|uniref:Uncharacterized protein n=1 Tax=Pseudo-nitzschia multistriata TaxID=183589 RepID=A0A448ZS88_9STRA|nr:unnamed protein product [Pseudo-nitzschia multistriata]